MRDRAAARPALSWWVLFELASSRGRVEEKLGLRAWSFHALRHFFISALVRNGASIEVVRLLAGHSKLDVTQRYVHAEGSELRAAVSHLKG